MNQDGHRPATVWFTQVCVLLSSLSIAITLLVAIVDSLRCHEHPDLPICQVPLLNLSAWVVRLVGLLLLGITFGGLQQRKVYGQWLGALFWVISLMGVVTNSTYLPILYRSIRYLQWPPAPPYECWKPDDPLGMIQYSCGYTSYQSLALLAILELVWLALPLGLAMKLLRGRSARQFFRRSSVASPE